MAMTTAIAGLQAGVPWSQEGRPCGPEGSFRVGQGRALSAQHPLPASHRQGRLLCLWKGVPRTNTPSATWTDLTLPTGGQKCGIIYFTWNLQVFWDR